MIFLSAQPNDFYFAWQIEVQINNFVAFGIKKSSIHIVVGYDINLGISADFLDLSSKYKNLASFFFYPDRRTSRNYMPSIRPHIIKQHFQSNRDLECETIFFHDCDIIFTQSLPNFSTLINDDYFYFSDTRSYINSRYIKRSGDAIFEDMCKIVQIDPQLVINNDQNAGGAQYLLKNIKHGFWGKVEVDCENLFVHLTENETNYKRIQVLQGKEYAPINSWCVDMWAMLWNSFSIGEVRTSKELDFCWPYQHLKMWKNKKIFHNAGVKLGQSQNVFYKQAFRSVTPFECDLNHYKSTLCSYNYVKEIMQLNKIKYRCSDTTLVLLSEINRNRDFLTVRKVVNFIFTYFEIKIILLVHTSKSFNIDIKNQKLSAIHFIDKKDIESKKIKTIITNIKTNIIIQYDITEGILFPPSQIYRSILNIRYGKCKISIPYDGSVKKISKKIYLMLLNRFCGLVLTTYYPTYTESDAFFGGCVIFNRSLVNLMQEINPSIYNYKKRYFNLELILIKKGIDVLRIEGFACMVMYHKVVERASSKISNED